MNKKELTEKQFNALVKLLDDEDPEVHEHVWSRLAEMGREGLGRLEKAWEGASDPALQKRLEETIHQLQLQEVGEDLLAWRKGGGNDLLQGWFLVTKFQYPDLDLDKFKNEVNRLVNKTWLELNPSMEPLEQLQVLNHILFRMEGYGPNNTHKTHPHNSYLNYLIDHQQGNVMSLSMLYLIIAQQLDLPVFGVLLPGYFILNYRTHRENFYIDVYNGGKTFDKERLQSYLEQVNVKEKAAYYKPTSNIYIILSLINVLKTDFGKIDRPDRVADLDQLLEDIDIRFE